MDKLPNRASDLIRHALSDLEKCETSDDYYIDMGMWHVPYEDGCAVCLGGSVMAQTLGCDADQEREPSGEEGAGTLSSDDRKKLYVLNYFRNGEVRSGLKCMGASWSDVSDIPEKWSVSPYGTEDGSEFKHDMRAMANMLEDKGY